MNCKNLERQAREAVLHYKTLFANPKVESITSWEFVDGNWLGAPAGFITQDNRIKPIYDELHKLIKGEWWTGTICGMTDDTGSFSFSGFAGEYEMVCKGRKSRFKLSRGNDVDVRIVF